MSYTTTHYDITHLVDIEVTKYPKTRSKKIELIIGGEARTINADTVLSMLRTLEQVKRDLRI